MSGLVIVVGDEVDHVVAKCASFLLIEETREIMYNVNPYSSGVIYEGGLPAVNLTSAQKTPVLMACHECFPTPHAFHRISQDIALIVNH